MRSNIIERTFVGVTAGLTLVVAGLLTWIIWTMFAPFKFFDAPVIWPVPQRFISPGDDVFSDLKFCKLTDLPAEIGRMTTGKDLKGEEYLFIHPNVSGSFPTGCFHKHVSVAQLPFNAPPGVYRISVTIRYQYSSFRVVTEHFMTEEFNVLPAVPAVPAPTVGDR